jgi:hypothetical protein
MVRVLITCRACSFSTFTQHSLNIHSMFTQRSHNIHSTFTQRSLNIYSTRARVDPTVHEEQNQAVFLNHLSAMFPRGCNVYVTPFSTIFPRGCDVYVTPFSTIFPRGCDVYVTPFSTIFPRGCDVYVTSRCGNGKWVRCLRNTSLRYWQVDLLFM